MLPDRAEFEFDRGAEQGETLVFVKVALPLSESRNEAAARKTLEQGVRGARDKWFVDDGQFMKATWRRSTSGHWALCPPGFCLD